MPAMETRKIVLHARTREKLQRVARRCRDADTRTRCLIVLRAGDGWSGRKIGKALGCSAATVSRTLDRWEAYGQAGLVDRRGDNGARKTDAGDAGAGEGDPVGTPQGVFRPPPHRAPALAVGRAA